MEHVVFGDVHGNSEGLSRLIELCRKMYGTEITFYSVGDLIDRGPDSRGVIELCIENKVRACMGNHEYWLYQLLSGMPLPDVSASVWGAGPTFASYGVRNMDGEGLREAMAGPHTEFILHGLNLINHVEVEGKDYYITHSGITTQAMAMAKEITGPDELVALDTLCLVSAQSLCFSFPRFKSYLDNNVYPFSNQGVQVFGHQIVSHAMVTDHYIALDTGSGTATPFKLSAVVLGTGDIISVT